MLLALSALSRCYVVNWRVVFASMLTLDPWTRSLLVSLPFGLSVVQLSS